MIKKKIKLYYKNIVSKTFENIHGKVFLKKNTSAFLDISQVKDPFFKSYENKKYNIYKVKKARIFTDNNENVAVIKNNILIPKLSFQQIKGRLKLLVSFNLGLAHAAAPLLVHRQVVQAKESFTLLKAGRQRCVPNLPASRQLSPLPSIGNQR